MAKVTLELGQADAARASLVLEKVLAICDIGPVTDGTLSAVHTAAEELRDMAYKLGEGNLRELAGALRVAARAASS
jgi:hypothetical protein